MADASTVSGARVGGVIASAARALADTSASPRLDAELLMASVLGVDRTRLILDSQALIDGEAHERFDRLTRRRRAGEPVAYLVGERSFRRLRLGVDGRVLVPRPETEELVQAALDELPFAASVVDVGTGSGAIALSLALERPDLDVRAVDVSEAALAVARANASNLTLDVSFTVSDLLSAVAPVDAVIANLPYVPADAPLPVDVAAYEPPVALFGGADGLVLLRRLAGQITARPWPAWLGLEIGEDQGAAVAGLVRGAGFAEVQVRQDLSGRDRVVIGRRRVPDGPVPDDRGTATAAKVRR